jgi:hypothetical protein
MTTVSIFAGSKFEGELSLENENRNTFARIFWLFIPLFVWYTQARSRMIATRHEGTGTLFNSAKGHLL